MSNMSALISSSKTPSTDTLSSSNISTTNISLSNDTNTKPAKSKKKKSRQLDPEARLKRTQQNRAAQRAFRERKEKKMRELENKVTKLTEIQRQNEIESSFLRDQLNLLLLELKKYRPTTENDLKILNYLSKHSNDSESSTVPTLNTVDTTTTTTSSSHNTNWLDKLLLDNDLFTQQLFDNQLHNSTDNSASPLSFSNKYNDNQIVFNSNANSKDQLNSDTALDFDNQFDEQVANFCVKMNEACGTKNNPIPRNKSLVTTDTPFTNSNILSHSPLSSNSLSFVSTSSHTNNSNNNKNDLTTSLPFTNYANNSDVNPFEINTNQNLDSPQLTTSSTNTTTSNNNNNNNNNTSITDEISLNGQDAKSSFDLQFLSNDFEIPFINSELAFPTVNNENDLYFRDTNPLKGTTTNNILDDFIADEENNIYDEGLKIRQSLPTSLFNEVPYTVQLATTNNKDQFHGHDDDDDNNNIEDGDPQVVPSKDGKMLKCSEIWDRITTHPKYSELDIDGLCAELMAKAKCSDKGAVVDADVVQDVLTKHIQ